MSPTSRTLLRRVRREVDAGNEVAVVVSAMAGVTNQLVEWTRETSRVHDAREYDVVVSSGEQVTARSARSCAAGSWGRCALVARLAGTAAYRRRARQGAHRGDRGHRDPAPLGTRVRSPWWRGSRGSARADVSPRSAAVVPTPPLWRSQPRSRPIAATSSPMSTVSIRAIRASLPKRASSLGSPTKKCWRWHRRAPRCWRRARSKWR